jgi:hypothetical protein
MHQIFVVFTQFDIFAEQLRPVKLRQVFGARPMDDSDPWEWLGMLVTQLRLSERNIPALMAENVFGCQPFVGQQIFDFVRGQRTFRADQKKSGVFLIEDGSIWRREMHGRFPQLFRHRVFAFLLILRRMNITLGKDVQQMIIQKIWDGMRD